MNMKKLMFLSAVLAFIVSSLSVSAKSRAGNLYYQDRYVGNVNFNIGGTIGHRDELSLLTTHGWAFGNGLFFGGGTGILFPLEFGDRDRGISIPVFADTRYSVMDRNVSPFFELKFGIAYSMELGSTGLLASPSMGIDIGRWSVSVSYIFQAYNAYRTYDTTVTPSRMVWTPYRYSTITLGCSWNF